MSKRPRRAPVQTELSRPSPARVYDYLLGGFAHLASDRALARRMLVAFPGLRDAVRENRKYLRRVVRFLSERGIRQFLDLGSGFPEPGGVHELAPAFAPDSRVVQVDSDSVAVAVGEYATRNAKTVTVVEGDLRDPDALLAPSAAGSSALAEPLDRDQPIGVLMLATPHFLPDDVATGVFERYRDLIAPGSYLAISNITDDDLAEAAALRELCGHELTFRSKDQLAELMRGFDLIDPGIVHTGRWRPDGACADGACPDGPERAACYAAVGRKAGP